MKKRARRRSPIDSINSGRIVSDQVFELCLSRESECGGDATWVSPARWPSYKTFFTSSLTLWTIRLACFLLHCKGGFVIFNKRPAITLHPNYERGSFNEKKMTSSIRTAFKIRHPNLGNDYKKFIKGFSIRTLGPYSQQFIFFLTYEWAQ